jgi:ABC-type branched-subunit amino acid transport system ATPase component
MNFVMRLCDRITVLNFGRVIAEGAPRAIREDAAVIEAYLGSKLARRLAGAAP